MADNTDEKLTLPTLDGEAAPIIEEPPITTPESITEAHAAGLTINEVFEATIPDESGSSLLGSSSHSGAVRNYEVYNRMDGCSSDEETQTDNDDSNSIEDDTENLHEHHYAALHDEMFEFGEFTSAEISGEVSSDGRTELQESTTVASIVPRAPEAANEDHNIGSSFQVIDSGTNQCDSTVSPSPVEVAYVSIPPLSAGTDARTLDYNSVFCTLPVFG